MEMSNSVHSQPLIEHNNGGEYRQIKLWIIFKLLLFFFKMIFFFLPCRRAANLLTFLLMSHWDPWVLTTQGGD